jgi:plasmid stability protein
VIFRGPCAILVSRGENTVLHIQLPPDTEAKLRERAATCGQDVAAYAARVLEEAVVTPSVQELLAPFRRQVEQSGIADEELDGLFEELRDTVSRDQHRGLAKST